MRVTTTTTGGVSGRSGGGSRWCPTPEQVMLLEGMYRDGLKTPTATQIQQITERLSIYGKIQGKNVFYWFQNHKARDRQKLRKKFMLLYQQQQLLYPTTHHPFIPTLHHQAGGVEDSSSKCKPVMINNWMQGDNLAPSSHDDHTSKLLICDNCPLMASMMMTTDHHHGTTPYCTRVPPKTLQLFPLTTTNLKEVTDQGF